MNKELLGGNCNKSGNFVVVVAVVESDQLW